MGAHKHILTAMQRLFTMAGCRTERKIVPHSRGLKNADLWMEDLQLAGIRNVIVDVTLRHKFHGSCANLECDGEPSYPDVNGALDAAVKEKLDNYQHDYNERNVVSLPAVMTTLGRISGNFLRLLTYCPTVMPRTTSHARASLTHPSRPSNNAEARPSTTKSCCHRPSVCPGHCHEDRHRPTQALSPQASAKRPRPFLFRIPPHALLND
jgi:hypothetical protein